MKFDRIARLGGLGTLLCFCTVASASGRTIASAKPVALVYSLAGETALKAPSEVRRPLRLFDRLAAGSTVEVGQGSHVALVFANGRRYELGARSKATLGRADLSFRTGLVRSLPAVHPLPRLSPIAQEEQPGLSAGAVRIRSERIAGLYPRHGAATLAEATDLRFDPIAGGGKYRVEVQDRQGSVVFSIETTGSAVDTGRVLKPGMRYDWTVRTLERVGSVATGQADFVTLPSREAKAREALRQRAEAAGDGALLALLAEVDRSLGLWAEARDELRAAVRRLPSDSGLAEALDELERLLGEKGLESGAGVVIEEVTPGSPGEAAGLQAGDLVFSWTCAANPPGFPRPSSGAIRSPYDLLPLEIEEAPRRAIALAGKRGNQDMVWTLRVGEWGIRARPKFPDDIGSLYSDGKKGIEAGDLAETERIWRSAAKAAERVGKEQLATWMMDRLARVLAKAGRWLNADTVFQEAVAGLGRESQGFAEADLLRAWGGALVDRGGAWDAAIDRFRKALAVEPTGNASLAAARTLTGLGIAFAQKRDYSAAGEVLQQALEIREKLAPGTVEVTGSLNNLGILARRQGDLAEAEEFLIRGEELQRRLAPESTDHALFFQNLGNIARARGDLKKAEGLIRRALGIFEKLAPSGGEVVKCLENLAIVAIDQGDLTSADALLRRSLDLQMRNAHSEINVSSTLTLLGNVASRRGESGAAIDHYRRALAIQERVSPASGEVAASLNNLGGVLALQGDFTAARTSLQRSLAIKQKLEPRSLDVANTLEELGWLETNGGDSATAQALLQGALTIYEKEAPESLGLSVILRHQGELAVRRGHLQEALALHRRALDLQRKLAPETTGEAEALFFLGRVERQAGWLKEGTRDLCSAIDVLERQRSRVGVGQDARTSFESTLGDYYHACLKGLVQLGRPADAFHALERGRARSFLAILAERNLRLSDLAPELAAERRQVDTDYDRVQSQLASLRADRDDAEIDRLTGELRDLRTRQEEIAAKIRQSSPRIASLQDPQPLDLAGARAVLDPGTVLLAWSIGRERSLLFVVQPVGTEPGLSVFPIALGDQSLRRRVEVFRNLLQRADSERAALSRQGRELYDILLRPAEPRIRAARRIVVSSDGPLHTLPFAALVRDGRWLAEQKPIHTVLSATVYAELEKSRRLDSQAAPAELAAFGAPLYPPLPPGQTSTADPEVRSAVGRGLSLTSLPASGDEVRGIASLYPGARTFLGAEATEERAKSIGKAARYLHFACHGLLDERFPLNSALALTIPEHPKEGEDNGILQAWEIFESVRLDADLVTLSSCDSALGQEMGGEGLLGLTRAFQYAGARSVLASLWSVSDVSTSDLMKRFYGHLRAGKSKDEALRAAQVAMIRSREFSHPYFWAAFQLSGDWR